MHPYGNIGDDRMELDNGEYSQFGDHPLRRSIGPQNENRYGTTIVNWVANNRFYITRWSFNSSVICLSPNLAVMGTDGDQSNYNFKMKSPWPNMFVRTLDPRPTNHGTGTFLGNLGRGRTTDAAHPLLLLIYIITTWNTHAHSVRLLISINFILFFTEIKVRLTWSRINSHRGGSLHLMHLKTNVHIEHNKLFNQFNIRLPNYRKANYRFKLK